jgi:cell shape-determining protein MreC
LLKILRDELEADLARLAEIQELRAENERLRAELARPEVAALRAEIKRLKAYEQMWHEQYASDLVQARAEIERLKAEFREQITEEHAAYQELHRDNQRLRQLLGTISELLETFNPDA